MRRDRFVPRPLSHRPATAFATVEAAWMWFWQCQASRDAGARVVADAGAVARPCDPDDIYRVVARLHRARDLTVPQLHVLVRHGRRLVPPDGRVPEEAAAARLWAEALGRLEASLIAKGIVAAPDAVSESPSDAAPGGGR